MRGDRKTDIPGVYKTPEGFLINKDNNALAAYKAKRVKNKNREQDLNNLKEEVSTIKNDLEEIKDLLKGLVK
jgi:hypothetical protein